VKPGYSVYVIATKDGDQWRDPVKIGITSKILNRLKELQTGSAQPLGYYRFWTLGEREPCAFIERAFHQLQKEHKLHGEWFQLDPESAAQIIHLYIGCSFMAYGGVSAAELVEKFPFEFGPMTA
jgi:hypothetical protein